MKFTHYYQPDNFSCVQGSAAILLSYYGFTKTPEQLMAEVPVRSWPGSDEPAGTPTQSMGAYFCSLGLQTTIISFDIEVTDLSWAGKSTEYITQRLEKASGNLKAKTIGRQGTELYIQAYLDFIKAGGKVQVNAYPSTALIDKLLADGPIITTVAYSTLYGLGKMKNDSPGPSAAPTSNDTNGTAANHNIVISRRVGSKYEVYDSWLAPGIHHVEPEQLITAIATAQIECDNMLLVARKK